MFLPVGVPCFRYVKESNNSTCLRIHITFTCMPFLGLCVSSSPGFSIVCCKEIRVRKNFTCVKMHIAFEFSVVPFK